MKLLTFLLLLFSSTTFAQYSLHNFKKGSTKHLLADRVYIRNAPKSGTKVLAMLPIGHRVLILKKTNKELTLNGFTCNWYKVEVRHKGKMIQGYIWGGLIAHSMTESPNQKDLFFVFGVKNAKMRQNDYGESGEIKLQIRAVREGSEIDQLIFDGPHTKNVSTNFNASKNKGLNSIQNIIKLDLYQEMCGGVNMEIVSFWAENKLHYVKTLRPGFDAPMYHEEDLIFPADKGGKTNRIIFKSETGEDDGEGPVISDQRKIIYKWNGKKLIKS